MRPRPKALTSASLDLKICLIELGAAIAAAFGLHAAAQRLTVKANCANFRADRLAADEPWLYEEVGP